jgi:hypothetical protein
MEQMGRALPESALENLVALAASGSDLSNYVAESAAQTVPGLDPETVKSNFSKAVAAAQEAADALVEAQGVDADMLYESMTVGERHDIADAFARGDAKPLVEAAQTWLARHGGQSQVDVERLLDPRNTVNGGSIYRDASTGKVMLKVDGLDEALTVQQAIERKIIKVSWA